MKKPETKSHTVPGKETGEKASIGGSFNSGVTSNDPAIKEAIEKKATLLEEQPLSDKESQEQTGDGLKKEDIPDSTNESTGVPGTGQRQDTN
jgi:hypothetical protein